MSEWCEMTVRVSEKLAWCVLLAEGWAKVNVTPACRLLEVALYRASESGLFSESKTLEGESSSLQEVRKVFIGLHLNHIAASQCK